MAIRVKYEGNSELILLDKQGEVSSTEGGVVSVMDANKISYMSFTNVHNTDDMQFKLYITDGTMTGTFYLLWLTTIPHGSTLTLQGSSECAFDNATYKLVILGVAADTKIDVIIK